MSNILARFHYHPVCKAIGKFGHKLYKQHQNHSYTMSKNGEEWLLSMAGKLGFENIFDVGANVGEWSQYALKHSPKIKIHCFEAIPQTFDLLNQNLDKNRDNIIFNNVGLGDKSEKVVFNYFPDANGLSTAYDYPHQAEKLQVPCQMITGDEYIKSSGLKKIGLVKIDIEGNEMKALIGLSNAFSKKTIDMVQFEYGQINILSRSLLLDFYSFFSNHGYIVGKLLPNYVDFREYEFSDENFLGPNYIAVHGSNRTLIDLLSRK